MLIHSCSSLENPTRFQTKMGKVYTRFRPKRRKNPTRWGGTYLYDLYKEVPPPPGEIRLILSFVLSKNRLKFAKNYFNGPNKEDMTEL